MASRAHETERAIQCVLPRAVTEPTPSSLRAARKLRASDSRCRIVAFGRASDEWLALGALTPTETHVLRMMGKGLSRKPIAETLHRSVKTIDTHRTAIMQKLDIHDRVELAVFAIREGLIDGD